MRIRPFLTALPTAAVLLFGLVSSAPALADSSMPPAPLSYTQLADPRQEKAAEALMETIRCVVCQGQSIADSNAELAGDMRAMVRERIARGEKPEAIRDWLIGRYGNWVSYDPPLSAATALLWVAPVLLVAIGVIVARGSLRRRR